MALCLISAAAGEHRMPSLAWGWIHCLPHRRGMKRSPSTIWSAPALASALPWDNKTHQGVYAEWTFISTFPSPVLPVCLLSLLSPWLNFPLPYQSLLTTCFDVIQKQLPTFLGSILWWLRMRALGSDRPRFLTAVPLSTYLCGLGKSVKSSNHQFFHL